MHFKEAELAIIISFSEGNFKRKVEAGGGNFSTFCTREFVKVVFLDLPLRWQRIVNVTILEGLCYLINYPDRVSHRKRKDLSSWI